MLTAKTLSASLFGPEGPLKGLDRLDGYACTDVSAFDKGGFLEHFEVGTDAMHSIKGLCSDVFPELQKTVKGDRSHFDRVRNEIGTKKDMVRAVDRRKELSHHTELFSICNSFVQDLVESLAHISQV